MSTAEIILIVLGAISATAAVVLIWPSIRRGLTRVVDFFRNKWRRVCRWYARCEEREVVAMLVNNPEEATPVFIKSLIDSDEAVFWSTRGLLSQDFRLAVIWKYRGFWPVLGNHFDHEGRTWAVGYPRVFTSVAGRQFGDTRHWTGSTLIDAATAHIDDLIEETGVADYTPPWQFRVLRRLHNLTLKPKG